MNLYEYKCICVCYMLNYYCYYYYCNYYIMQFGVLSQYNASLLSLSIYLHMYMYNKQRD